ncbi:BMA-CTBP-1, isoform a [Aphelenchoides besseyi]|nr:BMA-CTBP-1, isoform a [Aphelenchoides besseyi]
MPTTCGFPNCKFRSRYRGQEDNRHFYRIPKRPLVLRQRWLKAIGRTEETVLRICSAHFRGGEKREGDIPVPDPELDPPLTITLPPKENKTTEKRRAKTAQFGFSNANSTVKCFNSTVSDVGLDELSSNTNTMETPNAAPTFTRTLGNLYEQLGFQHLHSDFFNSTASNLRNSLGNGNAVVAAMFANALRCANESLNTSERVSPEALSPSVNNQPAEQSRDCSHAENGNPPAGHRGLRANGNIITDSVSISEASNPNTSGSPVNAPLRSVFNGENSTFNNHRLARVLNLGSTLGSGSLMRPLVALLDGRDCSVEMAMLKDLATVAFCDAQSASEIHERVLNEAVVALVCHSIRLHREDLQRFKCLKAIIRIGPGTEQFDLNVATQMGIAVCHTPVQCIEERANSTISLILNLYCKTYWTATSMHNGNRIQSVEQLRELAVGSPRMRGSRLLIVGLGQVGTAVALRANAFGFVVSFYDPLLPDGADRSLGFTRHTSLEEAVAQADCISFHCPLTSKTKNFVNMALIKRMKKGIFIVNINSEQLFYESDLLINLRNGQIGAAAFDCHDYCTGSSLANNLLMLPNVICTPGLSWYSDTSCRELRETAARETRRVLTGKFPNDLQYCVNKEALLNGGYPLINNLPGTSMANSFLGSMRNPNEFLNFPSTSAYQGLSMFNSNNVVPSASMPLYSNPQGIFNQFAQISGLSNGTTLSTNNGKRKRSITPRDDRPSSSSSTNISSSNTLQVNADATNADNKSPNDLLKQLMSQQPTEQVATQSPTPVQMQENEQTTDIEQKSIEERNHLSPPAKTCKLEEMTPESSTMSQTLNEQINQTAEQNT